MKVIAYRKKSTICRMYNYSEWNVFGKRFYGGSFWVNNAYNSLISSRNSPSSLIRDGKKEVSNKHTFCNLDITCRCEWQRRIFPRKILVNTFTCLIPLSNGLSLVTSFDYEYPLQQKSFFFSFQLGQCFYSAPPPPHPQLSRIRCTIKPLPAS